MDVIHRLTPPPPPPHWAGGQISPNRTPRDGEEFNSDPVGKGIPFDHLAVSNFTDTPIPSP
jgi:hypothetical protein